MTWKRLLLLDAALLGLAILASRAALLLHEVVGHGLTALALGADSFTLKLSLFGGGYVQTPHFQTTRAGFALFTLGGIAVNLLTGAAAWIVARRLRRRGLLYAFLLMFAVGSMGQALFYLANGFFFGVEDPRGFVGPGGDLAPLQWVWTLFPIPFAVCAGFAARHWLDFLAGHAPVDTPRRRFGWAVATVGVVTAAYFALWGATWDSRVDVTLRQKNRQKIAVGLLEEKIKEAAKRPPPPPMPPPPAAVPAPPPASTVIEVTDAEVDARAPLPMAAVTMLLAGLAGAAFVLWRTRPLPAEPSPLSPLRAAIPVALAAGVICAIALAGK